MRHTRLRKTAGKEMLERDLVLKCNAAVDQTNDYVLTLRTFYGSLPLVSTQRTWPRKSQVPTRCLNRLPRPKVDFKQGDLRPPAKSERVQVCREQKQRAVNANIWLVNTNTKSLCLLSKARAHFVNLNSTTFVVLWKQ